MQPGTSATTLCRTQLPQSGKCAASAVLRKEDRTRRPSPSTNDFCSALALDACCMQRPMKRKVRWSDFFSSDLVSLCFSLFRCSLEGEADFHALALSLGQRQNQEMRHHGCRPPAHLCFFSFFFFCMNAPCQLTREIKMVVCISCRVAVALPAFPSCFMFLVWGSHKIKAFFLKI